MNAPSYADLNYLISCVMAGVTASLRFPGKLNGDLRKLGVNLVPFPRLHFFLIAQAPLSSQDNKAYLKVNVQELTNQSFSPRNFFSNVKPDDGKYMTASLLFRGKMSTQEVDENIEKRQAANSDDFVEWIPNNMKASVVEIPPKDAEQSCTFVANTTALKGIFQRLATQFGAMYKRKAFLHWYKGEGMDEMEFQEADKNVRDLITEYQDKQDAEVGGDDDEVADWKEVQDERAFISMSSQFDLALNFVANTFFTCAPTGKPWGVIHRAFFGYGVLWQPLGCTSHSRKLTRFWEAPGWIYAV